MLVGVLFPAVFFEDGTVMKLMVTQRNKIYLDIIRLVAIFCVVYNHTPGFDVPAYEGWNQLGYWSALVVNQMVKMAVPLFFMVTGALLLAKEEGIRALFRKRVFRYAVVVVIITVVQYAFFCYSSQEEFSLKTLFSQFYHGVICNEFRASWFLYAYIGMLLMLPLIRPLSRCAADAVFVYLFVVQFVFCCAIPAAVLCLGEYEGYCTYSNWILFQPETGTLPFSAGYCVFYLLAGYFLEHRVSGKFWQKYSGALLMAAGLCIVAAVACTEAVRRIQGVSVLQEAVVFQTAFLPIPCAVFYMALKSWCARTQLNLRVRRAVAALGGAVFTVMLTENLFRTSWTGLWDTLVSHMPVIPAALVYSGIICVAALLLGLVLKRVPYLNRIF